MSERRILAPHTSGRGRPRRYEHMIGPVLVQTPVAQFVHLIGEGRRPAGRAWRAPPRRARSRQSSRSSPRTSRVRCVSSVPVGSSASTSFGIGRKRHRDQHALALAHRELLGAVQQPLAQAESLEQRFDRAPGLALVGEPQLQRRVLDGARPGNQVVGLADDPELAQAVLVALVTREREDVTAVEEHGAAVGALQSGDQLQQRRLARAAGPVERDELARRD